jgi:hypothetical protein
MRIDATQQTTTAQVTGAIQQAAKATGTSFQYLLATAKVESNLNPNATAKTSSAGGLFQFIEQTWLGTVKEAGASLGYGRYANAISRTNSGRYVVADPSMREEILRLRQDPAANAVMAGVLTKSNAAVLSQKLGRAPTDGELYIAHFLGAKGAAKLIGQSEQQPGTKATTIFPGAARANRSVFFDKDGRPRNVAEVSAELSNRFQVARAKQSAPVAVAQSAPVAAPPAIVAKPIPVAMAAPVAATKSVATANPLAIPPAASVAPAVATRLAAITPAPSAKAATTIAPPPETRPVQVAEDLTPVTPTANARVARAYEVLSPNLVRAINAPVSPAAVAPVDAAPSTAPAATRPRASIEGEQMFSNPYRAAERRQAIAPEVSDLWSQAAANAAKARGLADGASASGNASADVRRPPQRVASVAPTAGPAPAAPQPQAVANATPAAASASAEPLGLFQDMKPNVRALFTGGG